MLELTKREKFLLYVLVCFLLAVAGWFLLLSPTLDKNAELRVTDQNTLMQLSTLQKELINLESAPKQLEVLQERYDKITDQYNDILVNDDIDKLLTTSILAHGLYPQSMTIGNIENVQIDKKDTASIIKQVKVTMTLEGTITNLKKLIDTLENMEGVEIGQFQYQITKEKESVVLSFVIFMVKK